MLRWWVTKLEKKVPKAQSGSVRDVHLSPTRGLRCIWDSGIWLAHSAATYHIMVGEHRVINRLGNMAQKRLLPSEADCFQTLPTQRSCVIGVGWRLRPTPEGLGWSLMHVSASRQTKLIRIIAHRWACSYGRQRCELADACRLDAAQHSPTHHSPTQQHPPVLL